MSHKKKRFLALRPGGESVILLPGDFLRSSGFIDEVLLPAGFCDEVWKGSDGAGFEPGNISGCKVITLSFFVNDDVAK
jgi:hypothetical protein